MLSKNGKPVVVAMATDLMAVSINASRSDFVAIFGLAPVVGNVKAMVVSYGSVVAETLAVKAEALA